MPAAHTERRGDLPFARWDRIRGRLPPGACVIRQQETGRKRNELTIPDSGETKCGTALVRAQTPLAELFWSGCERRAEIPVTHCVRGPLISSSG
jgi:hypothetical protein